MEDETIMKALVLIRDHVIGKHADKKITKITISMETGDMAKIDVVCSDWYQLPRYEQPT